MVMGGNGHEESVMVMVIVVMAVIEMVMVFSSVAARDVGGTPDHGCSGLKVSSEN